MNSAIFSTACLLTLAALVSCQLPATTQQAATPVPGTTVDPCHHNPTADTVGFTQLLLDIERSGAIKQLDPSLRVFPFEIMVASQAQELTDMLDRVGYIVILKVLDQLTETYQHEFVSHLVENLF